MSAGSWPLFEKRPAPQGPREPAWFQVDHAAPSAVVLKDDMTIVFSRCAAEIAGIEIKGSETLLTDGDSNDYALDQYEIVQ